MQVENANMERNSRPKERGIFERPKDSSIWWVSYFDSAGKRRREKAGTRSMALTLYHKRKTEALQGKKLPETLRRRQTPLSELLTDAAEYVKQHYRGHRFGADGNDYRYAALKDALGNFAGDSMTPQDIEHGLAKLAERRQWKAASFNRYKAFLSLAYRLGIENQKVQNNPVRFIHKRQESSGRIRWLTADEETKLRAVIQSDYRDEVPAFDLALHTGMRQSEQYRLRWDCVELERRQLTIPRSKHGGIRYIPLDNTALAALVVLRSRSDGDGPVMVLAESGHGYKAGHALKTPKEWFMACCQKAGVADFTWHCLRHTFASRLVMAGVPLRTVQELMGHRTIAMTCRYAHLAPESLQGAVCKLDGWGQKFTGASGTKSGTSEFDSSAEASQEKKQVTMLQ
jgi:integrase